MRKLLPLLLVAVTSTACVFNVRVETEELHASYPGSDWSVLRTTPTPAGELTVSGRQDAGVDALMTIEAVLSAVGEGPGRALADGVSLGFSKVGDALEVRAAAPDVLEHGAKVHGLHLAVPRDAGLDLITDGEDVIIVGMRGDTRVRGGSGNIKVESLGPVEIQNGSGDVVVFARGGTVLMGSGDLKADLKEAATLDNGSGNISATLGGGGWVASKSGDVDLTLTSADIPGLDIRGGSGDVELRLPPSGGLTLFVTTGSGEIDLNAAGDRVHCQKTLVRQLRGGGPLVRIEVGSGNVSISD